MRNFEVFELPDFFFEKKYYNVSISIVQLSLPHINGCSLLLIALASPFVVYFFSVNTCFRIIAAYACLNY